MNTNKSQLVKESGLYLAVTEQRARCQNPVVRCDGRAVVYCSKTNKWLCQMCYDAIHDTHWGLGS